MHLGIREYLAIVLAGITDIIDWTIAVIPYAGEPIDTPFDIAVPLINAYLLKSPIPLTGLVENLSVAVPGDLLDYLPIHSIAVWYVLKERKEKR